MDFFNTGLLASAVVCVLGTVWRARIWITGSCVTPSPSPWQRGKALPGYLLRSLFSKKLLNGFTTVLLEIFGLRRTARQDRVRWLMHSLLFYGFMGLLLFHAMDDQITLSLFPEYQPTLDPWQWLRNLFGLMVLLGTGLAVGRRIRTPKLKKLSRFQDWALLILVASICVSGFFLEAGKIISPAVFSSMTEEYAGLDEEETLALKALWVHEYGLVITPPLSFDSQMLRKGRELNEESCTTCHAPIESAFVSYPLARALAPAAGMLNEVRTDTLFWYIHILLCFIALACLPFGKFFHVLATPANLLIRQGERESSPATEEPALAAVADGVGLTACTRCGECSLHCSVAPAFSLLGNGDILPSEKLRSLADYAAGKKLSPLELRSLEEGSRICTLCMRCTDLCPAGIDLQRLWIQSKERLALEGQGGPNADIRKFPPATWARTFNAQEAEITNTSAGEGLADQKASFWSCIQCTTCTSVCPVVAVSENPTRDLDLTPQQIMNFLRMGLKEETLAARMVWSCTTCYKCQEHCPQNIPVADILYELRNIASARLRHRHFKHPETEEDS